MELRHCVSRDAVKFVIRFMGLAVFIEAMSGPLNVAAFYSGCVRIAEVDLCTRVAGLVTVRRDHRSTHNN
jgi:hypothetical protein